MTSASHRTIVGTNARTTIVVARTAQRNDLWLAVTTAAMAIENTIGQASAAFTCSLSMSDWRTGIRSPVPCVTTPERKPSRLSHPSRSSRDRDGYRSIGRRNCRIRHRLAPSHVREEPTADTEENQQDTQRSRDRWNRDEEQSDTNDQHSRRYSDHVLWSTARDRPRRQAFTACDRRP